MRIQSADLNQGPHVKKQSTPEGEVMNNTVKKKQPELNGLNYTKDCLQEYYVISADAHVNEPFDMFASRVDKKFKDRMPHIEVDDKGRKWLRIEGLRPSRIREAPKEEGVTAEEFRSQHQQESAGRPHLDATKGAMFQQQGGFDEERNLDMNYDGIDVDIVFPNKGLANWQSPDSVLNVEMCRVWNDWAYDTFNDNPRSYPAACIAPADIDAAVKEIERSAARGFHFAMMPPLLKEGGYNEAKYDRIWAALCDANIPVVFHAGTGKEPRTATGNGGAIINYVVHAMNTVVQPVVELCASGVFDRYPKLKFSTIEAGAGWLPYTLQAMDFGSEAFAFWVSPNLKYKPSEYFRMHGHASFEIDDVAIASREAIGTQCLMWGNDYPHIEGCWPYSAEQVDKWTRMGVTEAEKRDILGMNAARLFNIPVPEQFV